MCEINTITQKAVLGAIPDALLAGRNNVLVCFCAPHYALGLAPCARASDRHRGRHVSAGGSFGNNNQKQTTKTVGADEDVPTNAVMRKQATVTDAGGPGAYRRRSRGRPAG